MSIFLGLYKIEFSWSIMKREKGTITMRQDGMLKALSGITTMEEVDRVSSDLA